MREGASLKSIGASHQQGSVKMIPMILSFKVNAFRKSPIPSLEEFCRYIADQAEESGSPESMNIHYRPQHLLCPHCLLRFDAVGKLETFNKDSSAIMNALGLAVSLFFSGILIEDLFLFCIEEGSPV